MDIPPRSQHPNLNKVSDIFTEPTTTKSHELSVATVFTTSHTCFIDRAAC